MHSFDTERSFWDRTEPCLVGDFIARPNVVRLAGDVTGLRVADLGCGSGYLSRGFAHGGAKVFGADRSVQSIEAAKEHRDPTLNGNLRYVAGDITDPVFKLRIPKGNDLALLVSVLMYGDATKLAESIITAYQSLASYGRLILSVTHPSMGEPDHPVCCGQASWLGYLNPEQDGPSTRFEQRYVSIDGHVSDLAIWCHPKDLYIDALIKAGFSHFQQHELFYTEDVASKSPYWGKPTDYLAYWQVVAFK